jgi:multiple sugar transport system substrate-binding protein
LISAAPKTGKYRRNTLGAKRPMRWEKAMAVLMLFAMCMALVSCDREQPATEAIAVQGASNATASADDASAAAGGLTFRITWKGYSGRGEAIQAIVDTYNKKEGGAAVTLVNGDEDRAAIEALLKSDPETVYVLPYRFVRYFGDNGALADLTAAFASDEDLFYKEVWALGSVNGETYGLPWLGHSMCLLYNKRLLEEAGVQAESIEGMDGFLKAIKAVREKTGAGGLGLVGAQSNDVSWMVNQFIYGFGSSLVSGDGKTVTVNNQKSAEALRLYKDVLGPYAQPTWVNDTALEVMSYFREQKIAFEILGIWGVTDIMKNGSPFEVGILPLKNIGLCSEVGPMMLAIPAGMSEKGKQAAFRFMDYMISKEAQEEIMKGEYSPEHDAYYPFRTPIRSDMTDSPIFLNHPEYQTFIEGFHTPSIDVPVPAWQIVKDEVYAPGLHQVMSGHMSVEAFLDTVEKKGNEILHGR